MSIFRKVIFVLFFGGILCLAGCSNSTNLKPSADYSGLSAYEAVLQEAKARSIYLTEEEELFASISAEKDLQELEKMGQGDSYTLENLNASYRYELLRDKLSMLFVPNSGVNEKDVKDWYDERYSALESAYVDNPGIFKSQQEQYDRYGGVPPLIVPEGYVRVHHILVEDRDTAQEVLDQLEAGASFEQLLERYNIDEGMDAEPYHTLGYLIGPYDATRDYLPEMKAAALALTEIGQISGIVESTAGFHILQLDEKLTSGSIPFEMVRESIFTMLDTYKREQAFEAMVQEWIG